MKGLLLPIREYLFGLVRDLRLGWDRFWFTSVDPINLAVIRIITGVVLLYTQLTTLPNLLDYVGPNAWLDTQGVEELHQLSLDATDPSSGRLRRGDQSLWYYVQKPSWIWTLQSGFLLAVVCLTFGLFSRLAAVLVWIGHVSYIQRGTVMVYGLDSILALLTFYLLFAPSGTALSLDRLLRRLRFRGATKAPVELSVAANVVLRLIQTHVCMIYLASGLAKLHGASWWNGTAVYSALLIPEVASVNLEWIGRHDWLWIVVSHAGGFFTLVTELGFPILVWHPRLRPLMLFCAFVFQLSIGLLMNLVSFQAAMFAATLAFVPPETLRKMVTPHRS